jgi:hypothetical protein
MDSARDHSGMATLVFIIGGSLLLLPVCAFFGVCLWYWVRAGCIAP